MNCLCGQETQSSRFLSNATWTRGVLNTTQRTLNFLLFLQEHLRTAKQRISRLQNYNKLVLLFSVAKYEIENGKQLSQFSGAIPAFNFCRDKCTGMAPIARAVNGPQINTLTCITASHKTKEKDFKFIFAHTICLCLLQRTMIKLQQMLRNNRESRYLRQLLHVNQR